MLREDEGGTQQQQVGSVDFCLPPGAGGGSGGGATALAGRPASMRAILNALSNRVVRELLVVPTLLPASDGGDGSGDEAGLEELVDIFSTCR